MPPLLVYEDADIIVINKPRGIPSAPLAGRGGETALSLMASLAPEALLPRGRLPREGGLIHRIDTAAGGLVLAAKNQAAYDFLAREQEAGRLTKTYRAECCAARALPEGFPPPPAECSALRLSGGGSIACISRFRPWGPGRRAVRPVPASGAARAASRKAGDGVYRTGITLEAAGAGGAAGGALRRGGGARFRAECTLTRGFRHQVRCHLAWCGFPVAGDALYGGGEEGGSGGGEALAFFACGLSFTHPARPASGGLDTARRVELQLPPEAFYD